MLEDKDRDDIVILNEENLRIEAAHQGIAHSRFAFRLAIILLAFWSFASAMVILYAYFIKGDEPPAWAIGIESATFTGALALVFGDRAAKRGE